MRKSVILILSILISVTSIYGKQIKLLAIGNSFSDDAIEHYLYGLAEANGDTIVIGNMYIGGCSLETHYNNSKDNSSNYSYRKIVNGVKTETPDYRLIDAITEGNILFQQSLTLSASIDNFRNNSGKATVYPWMRIFR
jgi:hypothetical protein